ncbi:MULTISPECIES: hypothetical protein [unclassified Frondihabitans]|nr:MULTISPECIES: hypothetical protein [unclassified Frondihabitans]
MQGIHLVVDDVAARDELAGRGVKINEPYSIGDGISYALFA